MSGGMSLEWNPTWRRPFINRNGKCCKMHDFRYQIGCGSPVVKVFDHDRHIMSSSPVPLKTHRVGSYERKVQAQVSSTLLDYGSKLRDPSPKALV
ncbi:hypothetical protein TNCV_2315231 [Trichonephila clavipes]|nr:hypothetical protein TNCV_2315231 [Trichonephila clavipes]